MTTLEHLRNYNAATIDRPHVKVCSEILNGRLVFKKNFTNSREIPFPEYWAKRENLLLTNLHVNDPRHVVKVEGLSLTNNEIRTYDAGIALSNLLQFKYQFTENNSVPLHPFQDVVELLKLLRGVMQALDEIHRYGVVHADLSEANICMNVVENGEIDSCRIDYSKTMLIDFAFSLSKTLPLQRYIPIQYSSKILSYMADFYLEAIKRDQEAAKKNGGQGGAVNVEKIMHPCMDYYSLGKLGQTLVGKGLRPHTNITLREVEELIDELIIFGATKPNKFKILGQTFIKSPQQRFKEKIDQLLAKAGVNESNTCSPSFTVVDNTKLHHMERSKGAPIRAEPTPITLKVSASEASPELPTAEEADVPIPLQYKIGIASQRVGQSPKLPRTVPLFAYLFSFCKRLVPILNKPDKPSDKTAGAFVGVILLVLAVGVGWNIWRGVKVPVIAPVKSRILPDRKIYVTPREIAPEESKRVIRSASQAESPAPPPRPPDLSAASIRRVLNDSAAWPAGFTGQLRQQADDRKLAGDVVRGYAKILAKGYQDTEATTRHLQAWRALTTLSAFAEGGQFTALARQELDGYRQRTALLHKELQGMIGDPARQAGEKRWSEYQSRLDLENRMGDAESSMVLGLILSEQGRTVDAFHLLLRAAQAREDSVRQLGGRYLHGFLTNRALREDKAPARALLPELQSMVTKGAGPDWQLWLARYHESLGDPAAARALYQHLATQKGEIGVFASSSLKRLGR